MKRFFILVLAIFSFALAFTQTKTEIKSSAISNVITVYITRNFSGYTIDKAFKVDNKGIMSTEVMITKGLEKFNLSFDKEGKLVKKEAIKPETNIVPAKAVKKPITK